MHHIKAGSVPRPALGNEYGKILRFKCEMFVAVVK